MSPAILYSISALLDIFDGWLARRTNSVTSLGTRMDMEADALGVLGASLLGMVQGKLPSWFVLVGMARYLHLGAVYWRRRLGLPVFELPPRKSRRRLAALMMGFLAVSLFPFVPAALTVPGAYLTGIPFLLGFMWDGVHAAGWVAPRADRTKRNDEKS